MHRREFGSVVRSRALLRAKYRCEQCSSWDQLEFHHIGNCADRSLFNCRVLCAQCHYKLHAERRLRHRSRA